MGSLYLVLCVCFLLVVNTSSSDCLETFVTKMIYYVSRGTLNSSHSLTNDAADEFNNSSVLLFYYIFCFRFSLLAIICLSSGL